MTLKHIYLIIMAITAFVTTLSLRMYNRSDKKPTRWLWLSAAVVLGVLFLWMLVGVFFASPAEENYHPFS